MKRILFSLLPTIFLWLGSCCIANAQATGDTITKDNQIIQDASSPTGNFPPVTVNAGATTTVKLQFPTNFAGMTLLVQSLDGGTVGVDGSSVTLDQNALLTFPFQVGTRSGIYRVIVIDPNADDNSPKIVGVVQFVVPNPAG